MGKQAKSANKQETVRASVTFAAETYAKLEAIAREKKVSVAWVIRDAADHYLMPQGANKKAPSK